MAFKRLALAISILFGAAFSLAEEKPFTFGGGWKGLNNSDGSMLIGDNEAQALSNVDVTDNGYGIRKRDGYTQYKTIGVSTIAVRGGYYFRDAGGNDEVVHANNASIFKSVNGGAYSAFVTTDAAYGYYDFTDSQGYLWRATSNRDQILRYDGTTVTYYPSHPKGDQIEALADRLVISGTSANPNRVNFSGSADFTTFATGINESDPFYEEFGLPGQKVNAIKWAMGKLFVWTKTTTSIWDGTNQFDGLITDISLTVGTNQPYSVVYDQGYVYWQGQDRHFYSYDGNVIQKISRKLDISNIVNGESRAWLTTSQSDFQTGTMGTGLSATTSPGDVLFADVTIDNFSDGDFTSNPTWTPYDLVNATVTIASGQLKISSNPDPPPSAMTGAVYYNYGQSVGAWSMDIVFNESSNLQIAGFALTNATPLDSADGCSGTIDGYQVLLNALSGTAELKECINGSVTTTHISVGYSYSNGVTYNTRLERTSAGVFSLYINDALIGSATDTTTTDATYISLIEDTGCIGACNSGSYGAFDNIEFSRLTSSVYQSQAFNVGASITQWGTFDVGNVLNSGTITYAFYVDSDASITISNAATFTSSQTITSGSIPTVAVGPYVTWIATFTRTASTQNPTLNDVSVNWFEGSQTRHWGSVDKNHRILWSVAEGTATVPNVTYIYDPRFDSWLKYSFPMDAPARVGDSLYFGNTTSGIVYKWPSGDNDDGSAITAYWKTKDFILGDPTVEKDIIRYGFVAKTQAGSNLDFTFNVDASSGTVNYSLTDPLSINYRRINDYFPSGTNGTFINLQFGNDDADAPFELYIAGVRYTDRAWRVLQ